MNKHTAQAVRSAAEALGPIPVLDADHALELIEGFGIGTWSFDVVTDRLGWSEGVSRVLGMPHDPALQSGEALTALVHPTDRDVVSRLYSAGQDEGRNEHDFRILRPNGELRWVKTISRLIYNRAGRAERFVGVLFDVTEIRRALDALEQRDGLFQGMRQLLDATVWTTDGDGQVRDEVSWWRDTGQRGRVDGWNRLDIIHPEDRSIAHAAWGEALRANKPYVAAYRVLADGDYVSVVSRAVPVIERNGTVRRWVGITVRPDSSPHLMGEISGSAAPPLAPGQVRAARGYLGWSAEELAERAGVSFSTVRRVETPGERGVRQQSLNAIRGALETAGVRFTVDRNGFTTVGYRPA